MECKKKSSPITKRNWFIDAFLMITALATILSGIYFLYFPIGGYQGGRNPYHGITILFERSIWEWIHTWIGLTMVITAVGHLALHWKWVTGTTSRVINQLFLKRGRINRGSLTNILVDSAIAISFIVCSGSGLYFLFGGEGAGAIATPEFLFDRQTWDFIHAWSGVMFIVSAVVHLMIHWTWVTKVSRKIFLRKTFREFGEI
jgi:hypothetical protein